MTESKEITQRWLKRSFFLSCEINKIETALKLHDKDKMSLNEVVQIFDTLKEVAIQRSKSEQAKSQVNNMLRNL